MVSPSSAPSVRHLADRGPVIPVVVLDRLDDALPLAESLLEGGISVFEITLRTDVALAAIALLRARLPQAIVGAGTVCSESDVRAVLDAGGQFAVSPGYLPEIGRACRTGNLPLLPGVATSSEVIRARADGFDFLKLFPAQVVGGEALLKAWVSPFPDVRFCPTGGISAAMVESYLAIPNVLCVGGSWMCSPSLIRDRCWRQITELAKIASQRRRT